MSSYVFHIKFGFNTNQILYFQTLHQQKNIYLFKNSFMNIEKRKYLSNTNKKFLIKKLLNLNAISYKSIKTRLFL